jgi:hypothetical protein
MPILTEQKLACAFPDGWHATKYDGWSFYRKHFNRCSDSKAVDFLAYDPVGRTLWLVELKDYRRFRRTKDERISLWAEVAVKARDTLAGLFAAKVNASEPDQPFAARCLGAQKVRVVLHLEQPRTNSALFPRAYDRADVQQKLKQTLGAIDPHPKVVETNLMAGVPWTAESIP